MHFTREDEHTYRHTRKHTLLFITNHRKKAAYIFYNTSYMPKQAHVVHRILQTKLEVTIMANTTTKKGTGSFRER